MSPQAGDFLLEAVMSDEAPEANQEADIDQTVPTDFLSCGVVTRSTPGSYDYIVSIPGRSRVVCRQVDSAIGRPFGVSGISILLENTPVLIWLPAQDANYGFILGAVPSMIQGQQQIEKIRTSPLLMHLLNQSAYVIQGKGFDDIAKTREVAEVLDKAPGTICLVLPKGVPVWRSTRNLPLVRIISPSFRKNTT